MFGRFNQRYSVTSQVPSTSTGPIVTSPLENTPGYEPFMQKYAGATFNHGVYRVHTLEDRIKWTRLITEAFPKYKGRISTFGYDWMGRQFTLDSKRTENGEPMVLLFDPGFGEVLQIPGTFHGFHDQVLITDSDAALEDKVFEEWLSTGNKAPGPAECIGYKVPLFLGGRDTLENNEVTDMEIYWDLCAQIMAQVRDLPDGTPIGKITLK